MPARGRRRGPWTTLTSISAGGAAGGLGRFALTVAFPARPGGFPWATFAINVTGCLLIGVLMVAVTEVWHAPRAVRGFLGVGAVGGFTTFSTYVIDVQNGLAAGAPRTALGYLAGTVVAALLAVYAGTHLARLITRRSTDKDRT